MSSSWPCNDPLYALQLPMIIQEGDYEKRSEPSQAKIFSLDINNISLSFHWETHRFVILFWIDGSLLKIRSAINFNWEIVKAGGILEIPYQIRRVRRVRMSG